MELREKGTASKRVFEGRVIRVRVDTVELPNGKEATREVVEHPGAVCIAAINEQDEIILVRQYRRPVDSILLEAPAGKLDKNEDPLDCAKRELQEETGFKADSWHLVSSFYTTPGFCDEIMYLYVATGLTSHEQSPDEDEFVMVETMPLAKAKEEVLSGKLNDAKTMLSVLSAWAYLKEK